LEFSGISRAIASIFPEPGIDRERACGPFARRCTLKAERLDGQMLSPFAIETSAGIAALGLAAGGWTYAARWPGSQLFGKAMTAPMRPGEVALTFDDGPNPVWTPRLLDILSSDDIRATFFLVGSHAQAEPELVRRIVAAGHLIGNHSWSHPNLSLTAATRVQHELTRTSEVLQQIAGVRVEYFRPPYGARRPVVFRMARSLGMIPVLWNAMTSDWREPSADRIALRLKSSIDRLQQQGLAANIVLHDGSHREPRADRGPSVAAAGQLIAQYKKTHRFVKLDSWA